MFLLDAKVDSAILVAPLMFPIVPKTFLLNSLIVNIVILFFTIPSELRKFFRLDRSLLDVLFKTSSQTLFAWFHNLNKSEHFIPGFIATLHTFGRDLK